LVFQLKRAVGEDVIREREESFISRAIAAWQAHPNLEILGNRNARRLSIVSFVVRHEARYLHHNYVVALLNDLFGIQARGGCSCAGPYGHRLLGIDLDRSREFQREIARGCEGVKPGWVRVSFNYFTSEAAFAYILEAVRLVAQDGWRLLPAYDFDPTTGLWRHRSGGTEPPMSLGDIEYGSGAMVWENRRRQDPESRLPQYLEDARQILSGAPASIGDRTNEIRLTGDFEALRWFPLPHEVATQSA
jgi:hypothetical protein